MSTKEQPIRTFNLNFRFPIKQVGDCNIIVEIPMKSGNPFATINIESATDLKLTDAEYDRALEAANNAALRAILIHD